jgi:hypothetical protein
MTFLIVAFAAYSGAFGIRLVPANLDQAALGGRDAGFLILDDDAGRGR